MYRGRAVAHGWGQCVCWVCCHVSVCVRVVQVQLGHAGEHALRGAWMRPEVGCRVHRCGLGHVGEGHGRIGEGCGHIGEGCECIGEGHGHVGEGHGHVGEGHGHIGEAMDP